MRIGPYRRVNAYKRLVPFAAVAVAVCVVLRSYDPGESSMYPPCPFHSITGLYCPGCGSLRATNRLLHGNILAALRLNPLLVLSMPFLVLLFLRPSLCYRAWVPWAAFTVLLAYGLLRNLPWWPFILLRPH